MLIDTQGRELRTHKRQIRTTNPQVAKFAAFADSVFRTLELTVVCLHCGGTPICQNSAADSQWSMECGCTKRVLANPAVQ